jgi:glucan phosphorylase
LDSLACLEIPAWGYGIRYNYGIFQQKIISGHQFEIPDYWLKNGNPFEIERQDVNYNVNFYGGCSRSDDRTMWTPGETVVARAYDNPIPGYGTQSSVTLRLIPFKSNCLDYGNPFLATSLTLVCSTKVIICARLNSAKKRNTLPQSYIPMITPWSAKNFV